MKIRMYMKLLYPQSGSRQHKIEHSKDVVRELSRSRCSHQQTSFFRASGAVHLMGSLASSDIFESALVRPKSLTFAMMSSDTKTLRAAKSLWTSFLDSRYSIPSHTSLREHTPAVATQISELLMH